MRVLSFGKKALFPFAILVFSFFASAYIVFAKGETTAPAGGMCYIRNAHTNAPRIDAPDVGNGYAKVIKPGVYTIEGLRAVCTKSVYDSLIEKICEKNPYDTEQYMAGEVSDGVSAIGGCASPGCELQRRCSALPPPPPPGEKSFNYPVGELGSCRNKVECRAYCEQPENSRACLAFAKKHKLLPEEEIKKWEEFIDVASGGGPGGCKNEKECVNYCEDASHIVICTDFVAKHNLVSGQELAEMRKIAKALQQGARLPGNCRGKAECVSYCENPGHIDECLVFAQKAGLFSPEEIAEAKKVAPFIKKGETPGGCKSKTECVAYCSDETRSEECVSFLEKAGFMTVKQADFVKKLKGKSPGDCAKGKTSFEDAQKSCNAFCNDPTNQPVCFRFLEEAGIMTAEEATQAGSMSDFQACIPTAPDEIKQCFIANLGQDLFDAMQHGAMPLAQDVEDMMAKIREARKCVNRYTDKALASFTDNPDALACISSELGKDYLEKAKRGEVKCGDAAQSQKKIESCIEAAVSTKFDHCFALACSEAVTCLQSFQKSDKSKDKGKGGKEQVNGDLKAKIEGKLNTCVAEQINDCLAKDCSEATACFNHLQGSGGGEKEEGKLDSALERKINVKMTACAQEQQAGEQQQQIPQAPGGKRSSLHQQQPPSGTNSEAEGKIPQDYCSGFASTPSCSYVGSPDSDNYRYCKQCFPDK